MYCPFCNYKESKVVDKRNVEEKPVNRRRRECLKCSKRFTTYERVEGLDLKVVKKDGEVKTFNREKLAKGIKVSVQKRLNKDQVENIVEDIELRLLNRKSTKISSSDIGRMVLTRLKQLDKVAYLRFASVFLDFKDLKNFANEIEKIK